MTPEPSAPTTVQVPGGVSLVPAPPAPLPAVPGYELAELVGRGGMGKVYRARHVELNRTVAIKLLAFDPDEKMLARFRDEARAVARLQHPNIAQLYETGTADGRPFLAQEFVAGGNLAQKLAGRPQDPRSAAELVEAVARAVQHSHEHGILHRDLKPGNILLAADGAPKVTDFGLAKELPRPAAGDPTVTPGGGLTRTGEILGTPAYMPPEQAAGSSAVGPPADVYSLGAVLYEAVTGRPPFQAADPLQTLLMVLGREPVPPRTLLPDLPRDLDTICLKCLEKAPAKRYATAGELADDLGRFLRGEPIRARPVSAVERAGKWARRNKPKAALAVVSVVFALAVAAATVWLFVTNARLTRLNAALTAAKTDLEGSNAALTAANTESDKSYALATTALDEIVRDLGLKLGGVPQGEALLLDVVARSSDLYRQLSEVRPADEGAVTRHLSALALRSSYETNYGRHEAAARTRQEMTDTLRRELGKTPDAAGLRLFELRLTFDAATAARAENKAEQAAARAEYIRLTDRFADQFPASPDVHQFQVRKHWLRGFDAAARNDPDARVAALREAVAAAQRIADPDARFTFHSSSLSQLGMVFSMANRPADADRVYAEAQEVYEAGVSGFAGSKRAGTIRAELAQLRVKRAGIAFEQKRPADALGHYAAAEPVLRELVRDFPLTRSYHLSLAECLFWQGILHQADDPARCHRLVNEGIAVVDAQLKRRPDPDDQQTRDNYVRMRGMLPKPPEDK